MDLDDINIKMAREARNVKTPQDKVRLAIEKINPMNISALDDLLRLLNEGKGLGIFGAKVEDYITSIKRIKEIMKEILLLSDKNRDDRKILQSKLIEKAELVGSLPTTLGIRRKVDEITKIDAVEAQNY